MIERGIIMKKFGRGTLLLVSAVMASSLFTGCGKESSQGTANKQNEVYATIKKSDQSMSAGEICSWLNYSVTSDMVDQNEVMQLSYCSDDLAVLSDSVGSVIYDRNKKKVVAAVDLAKVGCDHFNSEGDEEVAPGLVTHVNVSKDQKWMIVYNKRLGKVEGKIYVYALNKKENTTLQKLNVAKEISEKDSLYQKIVKENKNSTKDADSLAGKIGEQIRNMDIYASPYAYQWKDSNGEKKVSVLVVDKKALKLYTLSEKKKQPKIQCEQVNLKSAAADKIDTKLPQYQYEGNDERIKAVFDETKKFEKEDTSKEKIAIPVLNIYKIENTKDGAKVYGDFWCETYYRYGELLKSYSGGENPGVMYLKKTGNTYKVTKTQIVEDGESIRKSALKICKGNIIMAEKMISGKEPKKLRRKTIKAYVRQNNLKIKAYKDYGWQYINL